MAVNSEIKSNCNPIEGTGWRTSYVDVLVLFGRTALALSGTPEPQSSTLFGILAEGMYSRYMSAHRKPRC